MGQEKGTEPPEGVAGLSVDRAVEALADGTRDPESVRRALSHVSEDGVVRESAVGPSLSELSKVVSTPETRVELARMALSDAREAAESTPDLDVVRMRLRTFETRLSDLDERAADLGDELQALVEFAGGSDDLYETGRRIRRLTAEANAVQRDADDLQLDLEEFERWLGDGKVRFGELDADASALESALDELEAVIADLPRAGSVDGEGSDGETDPGTAGVAGTDASAAVTWVEATLRQRVMDLLLCDLRAELDGLRTWSEREGLDHTERAAATETRLDALKTRCVAIGERLDALARSAWRERHGERIDAFETALDGFEPPVAWGEVRETLDRYRAGVEE